MPGTGRYTGVILAAGRGRRMGLLGQAYPKALLPVANEPVIGHHLRLLKRLGVVETVVVVGAGEKDIAAWVGRGGESYEMSIRLVEQPHPLGIAHALGCARPIVRGPILLLLGDYYFSSSDPERLLERAESGGGSAIAAIRESRATVLSEGCALHVDGRGRVVRVVEKPYLPEPEANSLRSGGFYALAPDIFDAVARTPRTALRDEYELSISLDILVQLGFPLYAEEIISWDANFTRPADVLECNLRWLRDHGRTALCGDDVRVNEGAELEHVVVGDHACISHPIHVKEVVLFPHARIDSERVPARTLVTPGHLIPCGDIENPLLLSKGGSI